MLKVIFIIGVSFGLGKVFVWEFSYQGYIVFGMSCLFGGDQGNICMIIMDVQDEVSVVFGVEQVLVEVGWFDVVVNNVGIGIVGLLEDCSMEEVQWVMNINVLGVIWVCKVVFFIMWVQGQGQIFIISFIGVKVGLFYWSVYCVSKVVVDLIMELLCFEMRGLGIQIIGIYVGDIWININVNWIKVYDFNGFYVKSFECVYRIIDQEVEEGLFVEVVVKIIVCCINRGYFYLFYVIGKLL